MFASCLEIQNSTKLDKSLLLGTITIWSLEDMFSTHQAKTENTTCLNEKELKNDPSNHHNPSKAKSHALQVR